MLDNIIILKPSISFYYEHVTMIVSCDMCDILYKCNVMLNSNPKWLEAKNIYLNQLSKKLNQKKYKPFRILKNIGQGAF